MAKISFLGATGTVTGSRFLFQIKDMNLLIDCGLFQGPKEIRQRNWEKFSFPPEQIDAIILTHAHIDHIGYIPRLCKDGFQGPIISTHTTAALAKILLKDSAHIHEEDARYANKKGTSKHSPALPLFDSDDVEACLDQFSPFHYGEDIYLDDDIRLKFKDSGHILGSALVDIKRFYDDNETKKIVFCGDLGRPARAILRDPTQVYNVDYLVMESTYGNRLHEEGSFYDDLERVIKESIARGGVLAIPSFAVGRTQTLLYIIRELEEQDRIPVLPIYVDSPMGLKATNIYSEMIAIHNLATRVKTIQGKELFKTGELCICDSRKKSKAINDIKEFAIIISSSGMLTGGRILHHLINRLPDEKNTILFVGYQADGTRGRAILEGNPSVKIYGEQISVKAHIENISGLSCHADYNETLAYLMGFNVPPKKTFIVHGEEEASAGMAQKIKNRFNWNISIPKFEEEFILDM